jgi:hypothetical protein
MSGGETLYGPTRTEQQPQKNGIIATKNAKNPRIAKADGFTTGD